MTKKCAWCGKIISITEEESEIPGLDVSHGICPMCFAREKAEIRRQFAKYKQATVAA